MRAAAFFDVDETVITVKSMFDFLRYELLGETGDDREYLGVRESFAALAAAGRAREETNRLFYARYARRREDELAHLGRAWFAERSAAGGFFRPEVLTALGRHRDAGHLVVLVSGSWPPCLDPIAEHLAADLVLCSRPDVVDGRYTGAMTRPMIGAQKAAAVRAAMAMHGLDPADCWTYGDHSSDLDLLATTANPVAVGDDPVLLDYVRRHRGRHIVVA